MDSYCKRTYHEDVVEIKKIICQRTWNELMNQSASIRDRQITHAKCDITLGYFVRFLCFRCCYACVVEDHCKNQVRDCRSCNLRCQDIPSAVTWLLFRRPICPKNRSDHSVTLVPVLG